MLVHTFGTFAKKLVYAAAMMLLIYGTTLSAQTVTGSITGVIQDAQGAVVPNAKVTLSNEAQGAASARVENTNAEGVFVFTPVLAGTYTVEVEMMGFKRFVQSKVILDAAQRLGLPPIALEVGAVGESITVEASAIQLETLNAQRNAVVTGT